MNKLITQCQSCGSADLESVFNVGFLPPVNTFRPVGTRPTKEDRYPTEVLRCRKCELVQLGYQVDPNVLFPPGYSYRSGTTKVLKENFADLAEEVRRLFPQFACTIEERTSPLIVDIGSNDGTLLSNFQSRGWRVQGVEPTDARLDAEKKNIPTLPRFWGDGCPEAITTWRGKAKVVTACNVFAHTPDPNNFLENVLKILDDDGVFVCECHYLPDLLNGVQYDTIYHEHLRYYSLTPLCGLFRRHGLWVIKANGIPTHGGSIRVYAAREARHKMTDDAVNMLAREKSFFERDRWSVFRRRVAEHKYRLHHELGVLRCWGDDCKGQDRVFAAGAPSRAVTLVNYCGLDENLIECVCEVPGSPKIGGYLPGTMIPVVDEKELFEQQPKFALLLSWHIAEELKTKLTEKGFKGRYIIPLPEPRIVE